MTSSFLTEGFLGTGAPFAADLNLVVQLTMATALLAGLLLAKQKRFKAHGICQSTVMLANLLMIGFVMWPSVVHAKPTVPKIFHKWYYAAATAHAVLGITAEILGLYILVVAGTNILPQWLRFKHWKVWMRTELVLWLTVLGSGLATYYAWYIAPFR